MRAEPATEEGRRRVQAEGTSVLRICIASRELAGVSPYTGGIGSHYAALAPHLAAAGHDVHVVTIAPHLDGPTELAPGVTVHPLPEPPVGRAWFLHDPWWNLAFHRAIAALGPIDVVFGPEWNGDLAIAARRGTAPVVTNLVTSQEQVWQITGDRSAPSRRWWLKSRVQARLEADQVARSRAVVGCSNSIVDWARANFRLPALVSVVPNFVDVDRVRAVAAGPVAEPLPAGPTVLYFGRLERRKGVHVLAEAMRSVWDAHPDVTWMCVGRDGDGPDGGSMAEHVRRATGDDPRLRILGARPPEELLPLVAAATVVVMPSLWENFSIAALEAKCLGAPFVATTGGGFEDFCVDGEDSLLVPPGDVTALAAALRALLGDEALRTRLGGAAAARADRYAPAQVVPELVAELERAR